MPLESLEDGRCCQESVPERPRDIDVLGDDLWDAGFGELWVGSTVLLAEGDPIVGFKLLSCVLSIAVLGVRGEEGKATGGSMPGFDVEGVLTESPRLEMLLARGESLLGDKDFARSVVTFRQNH